MRQLRNGAILGCVRRARTTTAINDDYLRTIMDPYGVRTKTEAVDLALRHLAGQPMSRDEACQDDRRGVRHETPFRSAAEGR
jgi:Arc/MetJ family transcription regulator